MSWIFRERVIAAIEHREADRVPINRNPVLDFYPKLKAYLGLDVEEGIRDVQADGPPANQVAMCRAAHTHGRYPNRR